MSKCRTVLAFETHTLVFQVCRVATVLRPEPRTDLRLKLYNA